MLWQRGRRSDNVVEDSGGGGGGSFIGGRGLGLTGVLVVVGIGLLMGKSPTQILALLSDVSGGGGTTTSEPQTTAPPSNDPQVDFVRAILGSTEDVWSETFSARGARYQPPQLVLFHDGVRSACGSASSAVGPFYCPNDQHVYLDLGFFNEMERRFHAAGDFARAYVIAHEVGHHVQNSIGIMEKTERARAQGQPMEGANGLSVRQELQADCFAGVWASHAQQKLQWLQPGDVEAALNAATAIGDDKLQQQSRGRVVPDSFTHGTSAQRVRWFRAGLEGGDLKSCDTFGARQL
jgi:predicted metalloprotease